MKTLRAWIIVAENWEGALMVTIKDECKSVLNY